MAEFITPCDRRLKNMDARGKYISGCLLSPEGDNKLGGGGGGGVNNGSSMYVCLIDWCRHKEYSITSVVPQV